MLSSWYWSSHPWTSNLHRVWVTSAFGSVDLKICMSKHAGANCFSLCLLLLWQQDLGVSLTVEYPSESAPSLSGEDGGEFPSPSLVGHCFGGLPLGHETGILKEGANLSPFDLSAPCLAEHCPPTVAWNLTYSTTHVAQDGPAVSLWTLGAIYPTRP